MTMVIRLLTLVRWMLVMPAAIVGTWVSRMEQGTQLPSGKQWLQPQPIQLRLAAATAARAADSARPGLEDCRSTSLDGQRLGTDRNACTRGELRVQVHGRKPVKRSVGDAAAYEGSSPDRTVGAAHVWRRPN